jgi:DNA replicative helicase MCM subunit Mcm2 (Cdc46/Mcm family)
LAILRLCIARAKLRFSNEVNEQDIADVLELFEKSQENLEDKSTGFRKPRIDSAS